MSQQVQELIDKIKTEGVQTAKKESDQIIEQAKGQADKIVEQARGEAEQIKTAAQKEAEKLKDSTNRILKQSARDMLLALRGEMEHVLKAIMASEVKQALSSSQLAEILKNVIGQSIEQNQAASVDITVSDEDLKALKDNFLAKLKENLKQNLTLKGSEEVGGGFIISYDKGKSSFEFTDESLTNYLSVFLNEQVSAILKESLKS